MHINIAKHITWQQMLDYIYIVDERNSKLYFLEGFGKEIWLSINKYENLENIKANIEKKNSNNQNDEIIDLFISELGKKEFINEY